MRMVELRKQWLKRYGHGIFRDQVGLVDADEKALIKRFELENGVLVACADGNGLSGQVRVAWDKGANVKASILTDADPEPKAWEVAVENGCITAQLPNTELAVLVLEEA